MTLGELLELLAADGWRQTWPILAAVAGIFGGAAVIGFLLSKLN